MPPCIGVVATGQSGRELAEFQMRGFCREHHLADRRSLELLRQAKVMRSPAAFVHRRSPIGCGKTFAAADIPRGADVSGSREAEEASR